MLSFQHITTYKASQKQRYGLGGLHYIIGTRVVESGVPAVLVLFSSLCKLLIDCWKQTAVNTRHTLHCRPLCKKTRDYGNYFGVAKV